MRIFFSMRHPGTLRNFASTIRLLAERGHDIHVSFMMQDKLGDGRVLWDLSQAHPGIHLGEITGKIPWRFWLRLARAARASTDYLRYLTPEYRDAASLCARADQKTPAAFQRFCRFPLVRSRAGRHLVGRVLALVERAIPSDRETEALIASVQPDLVLVSPLVDFASDQVEIVKSAQALGLRAGLCVHSWDNLTNKGLIRIVPDRVFVWNEIQKREAVTMHGAPASSVVVTGAPNYDQWFDRPPSRSREVFCREVGLAPDRPFLLYLCSSPFIAANEAEFVERWIREVRASGDPQLRTASVLVRPHPENVQPWHRVDLSEFDNVAVWPRGGANPVDVESRNDYYDSLYHSVAAVGLNTSALIEAGIVGRPVLTIRDPEFAGTQDGTLHFRYLVEVGGGLLRVANGFDEHRRQLADAIARRDAGEPAARRFVESFVRPRGLDRAATPILADAIEELGRLPRPRPRATPLWLLPLQALLYPFAWTFKTTRDLERITRKRERKLRPLKVDDVLLYVPFKLIDLLMRWRPARDLAKRHVVPRVMPLGIEANRPTEEMVAVRRLVEKLSRSERPLIVGPWVSEVGFELLYWIPFLAWVRRQHEFADDRLIVVSRGGAAPWYRHISAGYVDLFDFFTPEQVRAKNTQAVIEGQPKGRFVSDFDREVMKLVQQSLKRRDTSWLHPMQMSQLFAPFWKGVASVDLVDEFASVQPWPAIAPGDGLEGLPSDYVAVKFTFNEAFPDTIGNRACVERLLDGLSETAEVVLLNTGLPQHEGQELLPAARARLHRIDHLMSPRNNLDVQTRVISQARAFVGSFSGLTYLPPFCGVRSIAIYSRPDRLPGRQLEFARRAFAALRPASLVLLDVGDLDVLRFSFGAGPGSDDTVGRAADRAAGAIGRTIAG